MEKILEIGQQAGTPIAYLILAYFGYQMLLIVTKFADRHFKHIDTLEAQFQEIAKNNTEISKQLTQALSALNQSVATQNQLTAQVIGDLKPILAISSRIENAIRHCENNHNNNKGA